MEFIDSIIGGEEYDINEVKFNNNDVNITNFFKLPITYDNKIKNINNNVLNDIELKYNNINDNNKNENIYKYLFNNNKNVYEKEIINQISSTYTTNKSFLKDTQQFIKQYNNNKDSRIDDNVKFIYDEWITLKNLVYFKDKYQYITWPMFEFINKNALSLMILSYYNLSSPLMSLVLPIIMLFVPFFIFKIRGIPITLNRYIDALKTTMANNSFFYMIFNFKNSNFRDKIYMVVSVIFYFYKFIII